MNFGLFEENVR